MTLNSSPNHDHSRDHMEIARVAYQLWQQAGRPAGRYMDYWMKVEQAFIGVQDAREIQTTVVGTQPLSNSTEVRHETTNT